MKNRLHGLLALVLCLAMTIVPFAGAMAQEEATASLLYVVEDSNSTYRVEPGDRIIGKDVQVSYADAAPVEDLYTEFKLGVKEPDGTRDVPYIGSHSASVFELDGQLKVIGVELDSKEEGYDSTLSLAKPLSEKIDQLGDYQGVYLYVAEGIETPLLDDTTAKVGAAFEAVRNGRTMKTYEITAYGVLIPGQVLRPMKGASVTIELPAPDGMSTSFALYHYENGTVVQVSDAKLENGKIVFTASSFSPFALMWGVSGTGSQEPSVPVTGDSSQLALWFALAAASFVGVMIIRRRKHA